ncbi:carbamoyltransferase HypF [Methanonatronarchaeum sp. AMET-Sl]|uniref:carbamoyltransferase HypF n=1 Tax=Methanonatronarchaeum sp. AMET-Sl TaxID=3037654 RepID=UPI00244E1D89|nr:carbamoyltransferase HypF [Methanonatronarchaeum sp. AMET-Sl]WGI16723.1 carbamoyltransferase HypF [Methanonatronarchaeum sp. AMET-Sl]
MSENRSGGFSRAEILVDGVVQGVGFRPFVYRSAVALGLDGFVRNLGAMGVEVVVEGERAEIESFIDCLRSDGPPLSDVREVEVSWGGVEGLSGFDIAGSSGEGSGAGVVPPDTAVCGDCLDDIRGGGRFGGYWATSCVNCGPRFTVVEDLPYDRENTSMSVFEMCSACREEYRDPGDRRYHAQTIACPDCGPTIYRVPSCDDSPIRVVARDILEGSVVAVKGSGGTHLVCLAEEKPVGLLRERLGRGRQPFAVMAPDLDVVEGFAEVSDVEEEVLKSIKRPIVLLEKNSSFPLPDNLAPGLHTVGVMLPYSGIHHLLFDFIDKPVVMTSGNLPGRPMHVKNDEILSELGDVCDSFLLHDREIVSRCDDSVLRLHGDNKRFIRRSRGFVPQPLGIPVSGGPVFGFGAELDNTVAIGVGGECVVSQYVGDVDSPLVFSYFKEVVQHLLDLTGCSLPELIVCDLHPGYRSSRYAREIGSPIEVQHHHAHIASVMGEHDVERVVGIAVDGAGYGEDGSVWGGEVLLAGLDSFERVGGLSNSLMPGGDAAAIYPSRMVAGILYPFDGLRDLLSGLWFRHGSDEVESVIQQLEGSFNVFRTSSAGRFLDGVAALLGVCYHRSYEGEPAMKLEAIASEGEPVSLDISFVEEDGLIKVDTRELFIDLIDLMDDYPKKDVAATAQVSLARGLAEIAVETAVEHDVDNIAVSGGVSYNKMIMDEIKSYVRGSDEGLSVLVNERVPPGDGGVSYGQVVVGAATDFSQD